MRPNFWISLTFLGLSLLAPALSARPEYAARYHVNRCTVCHVSSVGGGVRNKNGKLYGLRNLGVNAFSTQDLISADIRALYYQPEKPSSTPGGLGIMAANVSANVPVHNLTLKTPGLRVVLSENVGGFPGGAGGPRDAYARIKYYSDNETHWYPQYVLLGRFHAPFGVMNDEHRTYTKIQTKTTWHDFEMGAMFSGDPLESLHYDLALVNGKKTGGVSLGSGVATQWGSVLNFRWTPAKLPLVLGFSSSYLDGLQGGHSPFSGSLYSIVTLDKITHYHVRGSVILEYVEAKFWNSSISNFISDSSYQTAVQDSQSTGWWAQFNYELNPRWTLNYKYDQLILDKKFPGDGYIRNGFGFTYVADANVLLKARLEKALATASAEANGSERGALDAGWLEIQLYL